MSFDGYQYLQIFNLASLTQWAQPHEANTDIYTDPAANYPLGWRAGKLFNGPTNPYIFHTNSCQYLADIQEDRCLKLTRGVTQNSLGKEPLLS